MVIPCLFRTGMYCEGEKPPDVLNVQNNMPDVRQPSAVAAVVLAAGLSRRMAGGNKLLSQFRGKPLVAHVVDALAASRVSEIVMVTGCDADAVRQAVSGRDLKIINNPHFEEGLSSSLCCGLSAVSAGMQGAMICLGDMPLVNTELIDHLINTFETCQYSKICAPVVEGRRGNPVLWPCHLFPQILESRGDTGARWLIDRHPELLCEVTVSGDGALMDVDTLHDLDDLRRLASGKSHE